MNKIYLLILFIVTILVKYNYTVFIKFHIYFTIFFLINMLYIFFFKLKKYTYLLITISLLIAYVYTFWSVPINILIDNPFSFKWFFEVVLLYIIN